MHLVKQYFDHNEKANGLKVKDLNVQHIREFYEYLSVHGRLVHRKSDTDNGLSRKSIKHVSTLIKGAFDEAVECMALKANPARGVKIPQKSSERAITKKHDEFLDTEEALYFLKTIRGHRLEDLFVFALMYGMRRSEVLGLKWSAIDIKNKEFTIKHTVTHARTIVAKDATKNTSSHRTYPMPENICNILNKRKFSQDLNRKLFGDCYIESDNIFTWENGKLYTPDYYTKSFKKIVRADPKLSSDLRLHDLRASCISLLVEDNYSIKDIQDWVGQKVIETTLQVYARVKKNKKFVISDALVEKFDLNPKC